MTSAQLPSQNQPEAKQDKRWYDKRPQVKKSVDLLATFPEEILSIIAEGINQVVENEFKAMELMQTFKSLGTDKVLGLYKSKRKLRELDKNPHLHKTMTYLYVVSEHNQDIIAYKVVEMVTLVSDYLKICKKEIQRPDTKHITKLRNNYIEFGNDEAKKLLKTIEAEFKKLAEHAPQGVMLQSKLMVQDDKGGMKLDKL